MTMNVKMLLDEVEEFINENIDEFEFIVDIYDVDRWEIDFEDNRFGIIECCNVFIRESDDEDLENGYEIWKKVEKDNYVLYLVS